MSHVRALTRKTATAGPDPYQAVSFVRELYDQDFSLRDGFQDNHPPFRFAKVDTLAAAYRASVLRNTELRRLFITAVAWTVNAVARWNTRHGQRRHLSDLPDHLLRDIGILRDQINAMVSGSLKRGTRL